MLFLTNDMEVLEVYHLRVHLFSYEKRTERGGVQRLTLAYMKNLEKICTTVYSHLHPPLIKWFQRLVALISLYLQRGAPVKESGVQLNSNFEHVYELGFLYDLSYRSVHL